MITAQPTWVVVLVFFGALFIANMAVAQLWAVRFSRGNLITSILLFLVAMLQAQYGLMISGAYAVVPHFMLAHVPLLCLAGPFLYAYIGEVIGEPLAFRKLRWHLAIPVIASLSLGPFYFMPGEAKKLLLLGERDVIEPGYYIAIRFVLAFAFLLATVYMFVALARVRFVLRGSVLRNSRHLRTVFGIVLLLFLSALIGLAGQLFEPVLKTAASLGLSLAFLLIYHMNHRNPSFLFLVKQEIRAARYKDSSLGSIPIKDKLSELERLMEEEQLYVDEDLSLERLAHHLELRPQQLSELLNTQLGLSFYAFVNSHRVAAAAGMLRENRTQTVLDIAYAVGFNSRSAFYESFQKAMGCSPGQYRAKDQATERLVSLPENMESIKD